MIKAVFFDVDDTLYPQRQAFDTAFAEMIEGKFEGVPCDGLYKKFKTNADEIYHFYMDGEWNLDQVAIYRMQNAMKDYGYDYSDEDCLVFQEHYGNNQKKIYMTDTMKELLSYLKDKVTIGVITNGRSTHQRNKINALKVTDYIKPENILISGECDYAKPDPRIFKVMEKKLDLQPEEVLYVGDAYLNDMTGAKGAGWETLFLNRRNEPVPENDDKVDKMVMTEEELLAEIKERFKHYDVK